MIRHLLRRLAVWLTGDPSPAACPCGGYAPHCEVYGHEDDRDLASAVDPTAAYTREDG